MVYNIRYSKSAEKYLDIQTQITRKRIMDAIDNLPEGNVQKLKGCVGYRLTVGVYRVLFDYVNETTIDIILIRPRGDVYKK
jgi:mRNA interferase RelE/StbE